MPYWELVHPELKLYKYQSQTERQLKHCKPILMLHGILANHRSWEVLAEQFWAYGLDPLYALDMSEVQAGAALHATFEQLTEAIVYLLEELYPQAQSIVVIGHGAGAIVGYRYWQAFEDEARFSYLFMLAAPHDSTVFPMLKEQVIRGNAGANPADLTSTQSPAVDFSKIKALQGASSTVFVNIMGNQVSPDFHAVARGQSSVQHDGILTYTGEAPFDGMVRGLYLPEAVNWILPLRAPEDYKSMNKDPRIGDTVLSCLRGEYYQIKLKLAAIRLKGEDRQGYSGPIAFEINGNRMPPDSLFHGMTDRLYLFDEHVPPLSTLSYSADEISGTITLHLKDLSDQRGRRRRMYTRLHIPLLESDSTTHTMQDSEGSDFLWRVICQRMPIVLVDPSIPEKPRKRSRGI